MTKSGSNLLASARRLSRRQALLIAGLTAAIGIIVVVRIFAAGSFTAFEPESGTLTSPATVVSNAGASGSQAVKFGAGAAPSPTPTPGDPRTTAGIQPGHTLTTYNGSYAATDNQNVHDLHVTGDFQVFGNNVTVTNVQVDGIFLISGDRGQLKYPINTLIIHSQAKGIFTNGFDTLTVDGLNITGTKNASMSQFFDFSQFGGGGGSMEDIPAKNLVLKNSWFHNYLAQDPANNAHMQAIHTSGVQGAQFFNNYFDVTVPDQWTADHISANFFEEPQLYQVYDKDFLIYGNTFVNGGYYITSIEPTGTSAVCDNKFEYTPGFNHFQGGQPNTDPKQSGRAPAGGFPAFYQSGNTLNGSPMTLANGAGTPPAKPAVCT